MLYYIHGYLSEPNSTKGTLFKEKLNAIPIKYRDCEPEKLVVSDCVTRINKAIEDDPDPVLIGSSLGGLLAAKTALINPNVKLLVLLNPAIIPLSVDISKIQEMPQQILVDMQDKRLFEEKIGCKVFIIVGTRDEVAPNRWAVEFARAQQATVMFLDDDHSLANSLNKLSEIIKSIIDEKH